MPRERFNVQCESVLVIVKDYGVCTENLKEEKKTREMYTLNIKFHQVKYIKTLKEKR